MRISDWSSDVCSSDLPAPWHWESIWARAGRRARSCVRADGSFPPAHADKAVAPCRRSALHRQMPEDRKSVVWGKSVSVRVDLGGRRIIKKKMNKQSLKNTNL